MTAVAYTTLSTGTVAVLTVQNAPVNALSQAVRQGLVDSVARAAADPQVRRVVIAGRGATFPAGADIREFGSAAAGAPPNLVDVCAAIEACPKPVAAAIHGTALGGGLEVALSCHYRVAASSAKVGLPEVELGILPGAGGTQRLPRLVPVAAALDIILSGAPVAAKKAAALGIVDKLVEGKSAPVEEAAALLAGVSAGALDARRLSLRAPTATGDAALAAIEERRAKLPPPQRGADARHEICDVVAAAVDGRPFDAGMAAERRGIGRLMASPQSAALRHFFFAQRNVSKLAELAPGAASAKEGRAIAAAVKTVGVIGAGLMGSGIATCFLRAGYAVILLETTAPALERGVGVIRAETAKQVKRGKMSAAHAERQGALLTPTLAMADLARADMVVEAAFESMEVKLSIFGKLDAVCAPHALLCTNTSALDVDAIAAATRRPHMVMGMHFFSPANVMRLVENVRGAKTAPRVVAAVTLLSQRIGKVAVLVGNCAGFVGNRMLGPYSHEAQQLLVGDGVPPQTVDAALTTTLGLAMGPFAVGDLAGLEIGIAPRRASGAFDPRAHFVDLLNEQGRIGQKSGAGYYRYDRAVGGGRLPLPDPQLGALLRAHRARNGICAPHAPRAEGGGGVAPPGAVELVERCLLPMVNEGLRCLDEGVARAPDDIDVVYVFGYGFPAWRGGPMHWAETQLGWPYVLRRMREVAASRADLGDAFARRWTPSPLLVAAAESGASLAETLARRRRQAGAGAGGAQSRL